MKPLKVIGALAVLLAPLPCLAQQSDALPDQRGTNSQQPSAHQQNFGASVDETELAQIAGREDLQQAATNAQVAGVSRNSVGDNTKTGDVSVAGSAFQNLSGLSVLSVNTGNNVAINASMNVNIAILPQ